MSYLFEPTIGTAYHVMPPIEDDGNRVRHLRQEYQIWRAGQGFPALSYHEPAAIVAYAHAKDMYDRDFFGHVNPDGQGPGDRLRAAGIRCYAAENIGGGYWEAPQLLQAWIDSPSHRANLELVPVQFTHYAIGRYGYFWVMMWLGGL